MYMDHLAVEIAWLWGGCWLLALVSGASVVKQREPSPRLRAHFVAVFMAFLASVAGFAVALTAPHEPFPFARLGFLVASYIGALGLVVQGFAARHLAGDERYGAYFLWMTWAMAFASATWLVQTAWAFALCWLLMNLGLIRLISLPRRSRAVRSATRAACWRLAPSILGVLAICAWLMALHPESLAQGITALAHRKEEALWAGVLLAAVALAQAGNWPFGRWLLESAVTPTPVSALMHAGLVNAGGLLLTRFAPVMQAAGLVPAVLLLAFAWSSVLVGTGGQMVQTDYKRQLISSTMAQMGLMLMECALHAYALAVCHLVMHGVFKAVLFLRSGGAVPSPSEALVSPETGRGPQALGVAVGALCLVAYVLPDASSGPRLFTGFMLAACCAVGIGRIASLASGRWLALIGLAAMVGAAEALRAVLIGALVHFGVSVQAISPWWALVATLLIALQGGAMVWWRARPDRETSVRAYAWLVHITEPRAQAMEAQPEALQALIQEAMLR
ncbi:NADH dehydrogenase subunit 5 [Alicyclobacillus vulcanalis]|uniref:NAD(P)H-quinone oxidoreductase subunit 5 n=1 Tax=Alicyclobacillus vulcanalis TaxID=252246 RepID=A0A1N7N479_9BACL|nr:NADH dehydrogenase subunit 5 [Alicyclobacillus vulcanalis]SIS93068.1 NAD(P)H-quinone oxidoreductase subunit 5 [Alicyclobacillus vulcanalis]